MYPTDVPLSAIFTYPDEQGKEYAIVRSGSHSSNLLFVLEFRRDNQAANGAYFRQRKFMAMAGALYPIRAGANDNPARNRLFIAYNPSICVLRNDMGTASSQLAAYTCYSVPTCLSVAYDDQSDVLITGHDDGLIRLWDVSLGTVGDPNDPPRLTLRGVFPPSFRFSVSGLSLNKLDDGRTVLIVQFGSGTIMAAYRWDSATGQVGSPLWETTGRGYSITGQYNHSVGGRWIYDRGIIDATTGKEIYFVPEYQRLSYYPTYKSILFSPIHRERRRWMATQHYPVCVQEMPPLEPSEEIDRLPGSVTAIGVDFQRMYVSYRNGNRVEIQRYLRSGAGWSRAGSPVALPNSVDTVRKIVGGYYAICDEGVYIVDGTPTPLVDENGNPITMEIRDGAVYFGSTETRLALVGREGGQNFIRLFDLQGNQWKQIASTSTNETLVKTEFVPDSPDSFYVLSESALRQYRLTTSRTDPLQQMWGVGVTARLGNATLTVTDNYVWVASTHHDPTIYDHRGTRIRPSIFGIPYYYPMWLWCINQEPLGDWVSS